MKKNIINKKQTSRQPLPSLTGGAWGGSLFFILSWLWASWWMGDALRIAYERSFFTTDSTLMHGLWQQSFGWLWYVGRALLTLYHWPVVGGLMVAVLLTGGSWLIGYCLRLSPRWRWVQYLPAGVWMMWTAHVGLNLFYMRDPGRILSIPFLVVVVLGVCAVILKVKNERVKNERYSSPILSNSYFSLFTLSLFILLVFAAPMIYLSHRHPYIRPLTKMQVQLLHNDYEGMSKTAREHVEMSYRPMAGYYAIALLRTGHLGDQFFDIKIEFDSIRAYDYFGKPSQCRDYHIIDCNYHAGLIRAARHQAVLDLTMDGPSLYTLKHLTKISLIEGDWALARKFLRILGKVPFEGEFIRKYKPMVGHPEMVQADPEFAAIIPTLPQHHVLENMYLKPAFVGYYANQRHYLGGDAQIMCAIACLYSKRMPEFLRHCQPFIGSTPPRSIAEGIVTQFAKYPELQQLFPQLQMYVERYKLFLQDAAPYMDNRLEGGKVLFEKYCGYYPYYYFFGNQGGSLKESEDEHKHFNAGVN